MKDIRLQTKTFRFRDKDWNLCCNMNVLADVQEACDGKIAEALNPRHSVKSALMIGAAMMNECADINGWSDRVTAKELGREIHPQELAAFSKMVTDLLVSALQPTEEGETEKN